MTYDELRSLFEALRHENAAAHAETRRHFDVAMEATRHEVRLVADTVAQTREELVRSAAGHDEKVERVADLLARVERLETSTH